MNFNQAGRRRMAHIEPHPSNRGEKERNINFGEKKKQLNILVNYNNLKNENKNVNSTFRK